MSEVVESLQAIAFVCAIWVGCAVGVGALIIAFASWKKVETLTIETSDEEITDDRH
jgi:hypothetical protein